jgi:hypothetical protein
MTDYGNLVFVCLIGLFVWDKWNKGKEKADMDIGDILDRAKGWQTWQTEGDGVLTSLWDGDLCRKQPSLSKDSRLKCWWHAGRSAFLKIAPIKMEVVSLSPRIVIFHDFISEHEVATVKALARPKMHRAGVGTGESTRVDRGVRDARHAWLDAELAPALGAVQRRTGAVTGLDMVASEPLQAGRYGVGGHFNPHYDHNTFGTEKDSRGGDICRIKTVIHLPQEIDSPLS